PLQAGPHGPARDQVQRAGPRRERAQDPVRGRLGPLSHPRGRGSLRVQHRGARAVRDREMVGDRTMKGTIKAISAAPPAAALTLAAPKASADGLVARPAQIPAAARAALSLAIDADRAARPAAFRAVLEVRGVRPEVYRTYRNPLPNAAPELRGMGAG